MIDGEGKDKEKVKAIAKAKTPQNMTEVKVLLLGR